MKNILLIGCLGRLGTQISSYVSELKDYRIIAGVDIKNKDLKTINKFDSCIFNYDIYSDVGKVIEEKILADVVIDFSHRSALELTLEYCVQNSVPLILGTTGLTDQDQESVLKCSKKIPIFWSVNMSIGINILTNVCKLIVEQSDDIFDIDVIEKHHCKKIDSPSGTAKMIAESIVSKCESLNFLKFVSTENFEQNSDDKNKKNKYIKKDEKKIINKINCAQSAFHRRSEEIRIHSIRAGDIPGEHSVIFCHGDEMLTVSHVASSKKVFAEGAINVIDFITQQPPGFYNNFS